MEMGRVKCQICEGEFEMLVIKDPRSYIPYYFNCVFCGAKVQSGFKNTEIL